jgi:hypothetical protein
MPIAQACFVAMKVCEGLDYAHNKRDQAGRELSLVHRDVSPQNILVSFEGEVKLIDFGIAKAAGIGANSQAPILKGKFGYMSPEQVRGVEIDRRSDVFSCGVVLYELLTGERLFVGESDFDTLEKVRNVEILPPSTYNRKIPDELERIVLKALSKDAEERYQNAIDLHDELQAFVYTAGEFYSRKDLAAWMKKTFGKEIEDETAKLESYRQLKPPAPSAAPPGPASPPGTGAVADAVPEPARTQQSQSGRLPRKPGTQPVPAAKPVKSTGPVALKPQPPARSQPVVVVPPPSAARSQPVAVIPPPPVAVPVSPPVAMPLGGSAGDRQRHVRPVELSWEDDELETRVYDGDDPRHKSNRTGLPLQPPVSSSPAIPLPADAGPPGHEAVAAVVDAPAWPAEMPPAAPFPLASHGASGPSGSAGYRNGAGAQSAASAGSGGYVGAHELGTPPPDMAVEPPVLPPRRDPAPVRAPAAATFGASELPTIPVSSFGARITAGRRPRDGSGRLVPLAIGGAAVVAIVAIVLLVMSGKSRPVPAPAPAPVAVKQPPPPPAPDPSTGFDLYVTPAGITQWKLDGDSRTDRLPSRIRGISPGPHTVQIEPPPGFLSQLQQVSVELGKAPKVEIALQPIPGITGVFESTPPGATVSLIIDGKRQAVGPSPTRAPLDPRSGYQVLFEKPGYRSVNRPIAFSGALEEHIVVELEKVSAQAPTPPSPPPRPAPSEPRPRRTGGAGTEPSGSSESASDDAGDARARAQGVLVLGSKPPCDIAIDGGTTGLHTPQKEIKLPVGRHRITLTNAEFGINETFTVDIKADAPEKLIKDYSDRLPN